MELMKFCVEKLIEQYREKKSNLAMVFIDLEKVFKKNKFLIVYVKIIQNKVKTSVKSVCREA